MSKEAQKPLSAEEIEKIWKKWAFHKDTCEVRYEANGDCNCGWYEDMKKISLSSQQVSIALAEKEEEIKSLRAECAKVKPLQEALKKADVIMNNAANMSESSALKNAILLSISSLNLPQLLPTKQY